MSNWAGTLARAHAAFSAAAGEIAAAHPDRRQEVGVLRAAGEQLLIVIGDTLGHAGQANLGVLKPGSLLASIDMVLDVVGWAAETRHVGRATILKAAQGYIRAAQELWEIQRAAPCDPSRRRVYSVS